LPETAALIEDIVYRQMVDIVSNFIFGWKMYVN